MTRVSPVKLSLILAVLSIGAAFRILMLGLDVRFHPDEALYATYARRMITQTDLLLADVPLDKPPLGLVITALGIGVWGESEFAGRVPTVLINFLALAVWYRVYARLWGFRIALPAALILALSPFDLAFAPTLFHDPLLTLWMGLITLSAARDQWHGAGFFSTCALFTKQSAIQFVPLFLLLGVAASAGGAGIGWGKRIRAYLIPLLIGVILLALWSLARAAPVDFWTLGVTNPGALRLIRSDEIIPRLQLWGEHLRWGVGFAPLILVILLPLVGALTAPQHYFREGIALLGLIGTLGLYWLVAYPIYERYLHPLIPLLSVLIVCGLEILGVGLGKLLWFVPRSKAVGLGINIGVCVALVIPFTLQTLQGKAPIGGDRGKHQGIEVLAAAIRALPSGSTLWDFELGWELGWYLGSNPPVKVIFQSSPEAMARAVCAQPFPTYFVVPVLKEERWLDTARATGIKVSTVLEGRFRLYRLDCGRATGVPRSPPL